MAAQFCTCHLLCARGPEFHFSMGMQNEKRGDFFSLKWENDAPENKKAVEPREGQTAKCNFRKFGAPELPALKWFLGAPENH